MLPERHVASAKTALAALCTALARVGVVIPGGAEAVRQGKFNGAVAPALWRALHDLVIVHTASYAARQPGPALGQLWTCIAEEQVDDLGALQCQAEEDCERGRGIPPAAMRVVLHQLQQWGCPEALLLSLRQDLRKASTASTNACSEVQVHSQVPPPSATRHLLLALGWLVHQGRVFEQQLAAEGQALNPWLDLLPPFTQDSGCSPKVAAAYAASLQQARSHVAAVQAALPWQPATNAKRSPPPAFGLDPFEHQSWAAVGNRAHHVLMLLGRARAHLFALQSSEDARCRLQHKLHEVQEALSPLPSSRSAPLTAYELHLALHPALLGQHQTALAAATHALDGQQATAAAATLFFQWMESVIDEDVKAHGHSFTPTSHSSDSQPTAFSSPAVASSTPPTAKVMGGSSMLQSLSSLPASNCPTAARLLSHLDTQLRRALKAAQPAIASHASSQRLAMYSAPQSPSPAQETTLDLSHFHAMAAAAIGNLSASKPNPPPSTLPSQPDTPPTRCHTPGHSSLTPPHTLLHTGSGPWAITSDVQGPLLAALMQAPSDSSATATALTLKRASSCCYVTKAGGQGSCTAGGLQPVDSQESWRGAGLGLGVGQEAQGMGSVEEETGRLVASTLSVARKLARTRAAHKQAMKGIADQLPDSFLVTGL
ncbi:hypothetical protein V8C86DRAFT_2577635 [Haematococcus lacustris]